MPLEGDVEVPAGVSRRAWVGRFLGPVLAALPLPATALLPVAPGHVTIPQMVRVGLWLNLASIVLVTAHVYLLGPAVLGVALTPVRWAVSGVVRVPQRR